MSAVPHSGSAAGNLVELSQRQPVAGQAEEREWDLARLGRLENGTAKALRILLTQRSFSRASQQALSAVGEAAGVDRAYLAWFGDSDTSDAKRGCWHEWKSAHAAPDAKHELFRQSLNTVFERWLEELRAGRPVQGRACDFPEAESRVLERAGIVSVLAVPVVVEGEFHGFLGLEDCRRDREWKESEVSLLYMLSGGLYAARSSLAERQRVEDALRHSEERFSLAMAASRGGFWDASCEGEDQIRFGAECFMSAGQKDIVGFADEELPNTGPAWVSRIVPADLSCLYKSIQEHYHKHTPCFGCEYRIRHRDGSLRWVETRGKLVLDEEGKPRRCMGVVWDVTERKLVEEEHAHLLAERERERTYLATLIKHAPVGIAVVEGPERRVVLANPVFESVAATPLVHQPLAEVMPEAPVEFWESLAKASGRGESDNQVEYRAYDRNYEIHWWRVRFIPLHRDEGAMEAVLVILLNVTEQVMARRRLSELAKTAESNYSQLEAVINSMSDAVIICDSAGRIVRMNPAARRLIGLGAQDVLGTLQELRQGVNLCDMSGRPLARGEMPFSRVLKGEVIENVDLRAVRKGTREEWIGNYNGVPIRDGEGGVSMGVLTVRDVTLNKEHERQLRDWSEMLAQRVSERTQSLLKYQEQLRDLATELARAEQRTRKQVADDLHDWVAQDLGVCGWKIGMARKLVRSPAASTHLKEAELLLSKSLQYTRTMISQLCPVALHEAGLCAALKYLGEQMMQYGLKVEVVGDPEREELPEEEALVVFQMVRELLFNVVKHAGVDKATVTARREKNGLVVSVVDEGKGFAAQDDGKTSTVSGKYGLFSIHERLEALGGWFLVESCPGKGTKATLFAPLRRRTVSPPPAAIRSFPPEEGLETRPPSRLMRIVVADDHKEVRSGLRSLLDGYSELHVVGEAANGEEAVELTAKLRPDAVIMDINMPKMNGLEATRRIRRDYPGTVVIGLSVFQDRQIEAMMMKAGAMRMLSKSSKPDELYGALREAQHKAGQRVS